MRMNRLGDAGRLRRSSAIAENSFARKVSARPLSWEEPVGRSLPSPVCGEHLAERLCQHHLPILVAFATANPDDAAFAIQVGYLQAGHFRYAESRTVHGGQNRPMAKVLRRFEECFNLGLAQNDR